MSENVFRSRNFVLCFLGAAVSNIGAIFYNFAVSFRILTLSGNDAVLQGLYLGVTGLCFVLASPFGGVICDRHNKGRIMYLCDFLRGGLILAAGLLIRILAEDRAALAILFAAGILGNLIGAVFSPASTALLPHILEREQLQQANSYISVLGSLQSILGSVLAALLYAALPLPELFGVIGILYLLSGVSELFIRYEGDDVHPRREGAHFLTDLADGFRYVRSKRALRALIGTIIFVNFFFAPFFDNFVPYFIETDVAGKAYFLEGMLSPESWNSVFGLCMGTTSVLFALRLSRKQNERTGIRVRYYLLAMGILMALLALAYRLLVPARLNAFLLVMCIGSLFIGGLLSNVNIPISTQMQMISEPEQLGKVSAFLNMGSQGLIPVATFLAGLVIDAWGSFWMNTLCAVGMIAVSLVAFADKGWEEL